MLTPETKIPWLVGEPTIEDLIEQHHIDSAHIDEFVNIIEAYKSNGTALKGEIARLIGERNDAAAESVENYKRASRYRAALEKICDLDEVSSFSDTHLIAHKALNP